MRVNLKSLLTVVVTFLASQTLAESTTIVCILDGVGKTAVDDAGNPLQIEQTIKFNNAFVEDWKHRFITDYEYLEPQVLLSGKSTWLSFEGFVNDEMITIQSKIDANETKEFYGYDIRAYTLNITVSRHTGVSVTKSALNFSMDNMFNWYEYHVSGKCNPVLNKF